MTTTITAPATATIDAIRDAGTFPRFGATITATAASFDITTTPDADGAVFGRGRATGQVVRIVRTGRAVRRDGQVTVAVQFATDTGDAAGTLSFDREVRGAVAPAAAFGA